MEIKRNKKLGALLKTMLPFLPIAGFNPFNWLMFDKNICITDGKGSFSLFESVEDDVYDGHYFYVCRGKEALEFARASLEEMFTTYKAEIIRGYTPMSKKGALWLTRKLGFNPVGTTIIEGEENQIWALSREQYERMKRNGQ